MKFHVALLALISAVSVQAKPYRQIDVCFALDTTASMSALIETAKQKIWYIARAIVSSPSQPNVRFCLMGYRDRGDVYVTKHIDLTSDIDQVYEQLIGFRAEGGGDHPEAVIQALQETIDQTSWTFDDDVLRLIFLIGDAPPQDYADEPSYAQLSKAASAQGIIVNPVLCADHEPTRRVWTEIARLALGSSTELRNLQNSATPPTPIDQDLVALNARLGKLMVPYGNSEVRDAIRAKQDRTATMTDAALVDRLAYNARTGRVIHGTGDLVADLPAGDVVFASVDAATLPAGLRSMSEAELRAHLHKLRQERDDIQVLVTDLIDQRQRWLESVWAPDANSFEQTVSRLIRIQLGD